MLERDQQVNAYQMLRSSGLKQPRAKIVEHDIVTNCTDRAKALRALIDKNLTYPASVDASVKTIEKFAATLDAASKCITDFLAVISSYTDDISLLVNKSIGFDCYIRGNRIKPEPSFALVDAIAEVTKADNLNKAVNSFTVTAALTSAMTAINTALTVPVTTPPTVAPALTAAQIKDLTDAVAARTATEKPITAAIKALDDLATDAGTSIKNADTAFKDAVAITMIDYLRNDARMAGAINALVPANILAELAKPNP